jgi:hypothetical protein
MKSVMESLPRRGSSKKAFLVIRRAVPKKCRNFDEELIRESESLMFITENGRRKRISKHKVAVKQLMKLAMSGNIPAARIYFGLYLQALERLAGLQANYSEKYDDVKKMTDEELMKIITDGPKGKKRGNRK